MKTFVEKFTRERDSVMNFCFGNFPAAKARVLFDQYRKFVGCHLHSDVFRTAEPDFLLTFASQVIIPNSDTTRDEEVRAAVRWFKKS